jgi:hypothetical protein
MQGVDDAHGPRGFYWFWKCPILSGQNAKPRQCFSALPFPAVSQGFPDARPGWARQDVSEQYAAFFSGAAKTSRP